MSALLFGMTNTADASADPAELSERARVGLRAWFDKFRTSGQADEGLVNAMRAALATLSQPLRQPATALAYWSTRHRATRPVVYFSREAVLFFGRPESHAFERDVRCGRRGRRRRHPKLGGTQRLSIITTDPAPRSSRSLVTSRFLRRPSSSAFGRASPDRCPAPSRRGCGCPPSPRSPPSHAAARRSGATQW